jgi:predicted metal-binding membrane protein
VARPAAQDRLVILGCRVRQTVTARVLLVVTVPWTGTVRVVSSPLVRSCGGDDTACVQEPSMEEPNVEVLCVEETAILRWRIEAKIALVRGSAILTRVHLLLPLFSPVISLQPLLGRLEH